MVLSTRFDGPAVTFPFCLLIHSVKSFHSLLSDINLCKQISDPRPAHSVKKWRPRRSGDRRRRSNPFYLRKRSRQGVNSTDRKFTWQLILLIAAVLTIVFLLKGKVTPRLKTWNYGHSSLGCVIFNKVFCAMVSRLCFGCIRIAQILV